MSSHYLVVRVKGSRVPMREKYDSKEAADEAYVKLLQDRESMSFVRSTRGRISFSSSDLMSAEVWSGERDPLVVEGSHHEADSKTR